MIKRKPKDPQTPRTVSYLRVSTDEQDIEKDKFQVLQLANDKKFGNVEFIEDQGISGKTSWRQRKIGPLVDSLGPGDRLIVPEISRLGRSMLECMEILSILKNKDVSVYGIKNGWELNGTIQSKVMAMVFSMVAEIERDFISKRTIEGLRAARAKGKMLGRPKGPGKSKLDPHRTEIIALLKTGSQKTYVSKKFGVSIPTLTNWITKNKIDVSWEMK